MMSVFKKNLARFLSLVILLNIKSFATKVTNLPTPQVFQPVGIKNNLKNTKSDSALSKAVLYILPCIVAALGTFATFEIKDEINYQKEISSSSELFSEQFGKNITTCELTKKQEGKMWCWIACLQGLLKNQNVEKSQKEIFKGVTNSWFVPLLENNRDAGMSIYSSEENMKAVGKVAENECDPEDNIFPYMINDYIKKISNDKLTYQTVYINKDLDTKDVKNTILEIYKTIGKKPFSLLASHTSSCHFVNITKIDDDGIMHIEDPAYEKGRTESIDSYMESFDPNVKSIVGNANGIFLGFITEKGSELKDAADGNYKVA